MLFNLHGIVIHDNFKYCDKLDGSILDTFNLCDKREHADDFKKEGTFYLLEKRKNAIDGIGIQCSKTKIVKKYKG